MINTWDSYCVTPEEEGSGTKVLDANDQVQPTVEAGNNIVIENGQISASGTLENVQANWQTVDSEDPSYIRNKPQNLVQDADYVHIDNNFTDADVSKLEGIEAGAQVNVKPDWDAVAGSAAEILNKPTIPLVDQIYNANSTNAQSGVAVASAVSGAVSGINQVPSSTSSDNGKVLKVNAQGNAEWGTDEGTTYTAGNGLSLSGTEFSVDTSIVATQSDLSDYQPVISDLDSIRSGAQAGATAVQPGSLATVATSGSYDDLTDKPTIPPGVVVDQVYDATSSNAQSGTAVAGAIGNVKQVPSSTTGDSGKVLKVNSSGNAVWDTETGTTYSAGTGIDITGTTISVDSTVRSGAAAGATAVQPGSLATVATSGSYADLSNKPTIPTVDQSYGASSTNAQSGTAVAGAIATVRQVPSSTSSDNGKVLGVTNAQGTLGWVDQPTVPTSKPLVAGSNITITENANDVTISAAGGTTVTVDQVYSASSTNAQSGTAVADALNTVRQLPVTSSADATKMLTVNTYGIPAWAYPPTELPSLTGNSSKVLAVNSGATGVEWVTPQGGTSYTAGDAIDISNDAINVKHDSTLSVTQSASGSVTSVGSNLYYAWEDNYAYKSLRITVPAGLSTAATASFVWDNYDHLNSHGSPYADGGKAFLVLVNPSDSTKYVVGSGKQGTWRDATDWDTRIDLPLTWSGTLSSMFTWGQLSMDDLRDSNGNVDVYICCTDYSGNPVSGDAPGGYYNTIFMASESDAGDEGSVISFSYSLVGNQLTVVNPLPDYVAGDAGKMLQVNSGATGVEWVTPSSGPTYTAGNGISIASDTIAAKVGGGIKIGTASSTSTTTEQLQMTTDSTSKSVYGFGTLSTDTANALDNGDTVSVELSYNFTCYYRATDATYECKYYAAIAQFAGKSGANTYGSPYLILGEVTPSSASGNTATFSSGFSLDYNVSDISSTLSNNLTWSTVQANPGSYQFGLIALVYYNGSVELVQAAKYNDGSSSTVTLNTATATAPITVSVPNSIVLEHPIELVQSLPASPDSNTLYLIPEA